MLDYLKYKNLSGKEYLFIFKKSKNLQCQVANIYKIESGIFLLTTLSDNNRLELEIAAKNLVNDLK